YTVKLEGAELAGYQSIVIGSVRDPYIIRQIDSWVERLRARVRARVAEVLGDESYAFNVRVYGKNGTMGPLEPIAEVRGHELCLAMEATAATQEIASTMASMARPQGRHLPIPAARGLIRAMPCLSRRAPRRPPPRRPLY